MQSRLFNAGDEPFDAGDEPFDTTPAQMATFLHEESQRWGTLIRTLGSTLQ